jgi:hypothetical protein
MGCMGLIVLRHVDYVEEKTTRDMKTMTERRCGLGKCCDRERRLMKATEMRIRIKVERSRTTKVVDKKREVGDVLKGRRAKEQMCVPVGGGCLRFDRGHARAFIHVSIEPHREPLFKQWPTGHSENCLKPGCVSVIAASICSRPKRACATRRKRGCPLGRSPKRLQRTSACQNRESERFVPIVGSACLRKCI